MLFKNVLVVYLLLVANTSAFSVRRTRTSSTNALKNGASDNSPAFVDVSDLGLTMEDLEKPLPVGILSGLSMTGYESTSRIPGVEDDGCEWTETMDEMHARLRIPGLRGQPSAAMAAVFSTTTISVSVFGRIVWSAVLRGMIDPESCIFQAEDGDEMIPTIRVTVKKQDDTQRWGGFILQIGEDSLI